MDRLFPWVVTGGRGMQYALQVKVGIFNALYAAALLTPALIVTKVIFS